MIAVALHNIPEGIAVAVPVYFATGSRRTAFLYSFLSGMAEPVGAALGYFMLQRVFGHSATGLILGLVAGIMVFISLDELLPTAREYGEHHLAAYGLIVGMGFMAVVLLLMP
jgi:ZIP family zinc transporter